MRYSYKYSKEHLWYMEEQVWECRDNLDVYSDLSEYEYDQMNSFIPEHPRVIMDLGCGLGRAAIYLNALFQDPTIHYILADTTGITSGRHGAWNEDQYYNSLDLTSDFCRLNGMTNFEVFDTKKDSFNQLYDIDFIISLCAFGMHNPIEDVMPDLIHISTNDVTMIFGTRNRGIYSSTSFDKLFKSVIFKQHDHTPPYPQQDWLVLKDKI